MTINMKKGIRCHGCPSSLRDEPVAEGVMLARRPVHLAAAKQMQVEMIDGLAAVLAGVDDDAVAVFEAFFASDFGCSPE